MQRELAKFPPSEPLEMQNLALQNLSYKQRLLPYMNIFFKKIFILACTGTAGEKGNCADGFFCADNGACQGK